MEILQLHYRSTNHGQIQLVFTHFTGLSQSRKRGIKKVTFLGYALCEAQIHKHEEGRDGV